VTAPDPNATAYVGAWIAMGLGAAMVIAAWTAYRRFEIRRHRLNDCGFVLIFSAYLVLTLVRGGPQGILQWLITIACPVLIALALWRLFHTGEAR